jgi:3-dehydroquinate synthase
MQQVRYFSNISELEIQLNGYANSFQRLFVLIDSNTQQHCLSRVNLAKSHVIVLKAGEESKRVDNLTYIWTELQNHSANKGSLLIALGGGMISDIAGFAAATYMRGISCLYIPTSLLAMVDAAHGGKTGIDFNGIKNLVGVFNMQPEVFICSEWLQTLPEREFKSGLAEIIKHYLVADSESFYAFDKQYNSNISLDLIRKAVAIKTHFIALDPFDKRERKALNFGHTIGHAIESSLLETMHSLLHGEAIAIGIICESYISFHRTLISIDELDAIQKTIFSIFTLPKIDNHEKLFEFVNLDKKNTDTINCVLLNGIGNFIIDQKITHDDIQAAIEFYNSKVA